MELNNTGYQQGKLSPRCARSTANWVICCVVTTAFMVAVVVSNLEGHRHSTEIASENGADLQFYIDTNALVGAQCGRRSANKAGKPEAFPP